MPTLPSTTKRKKERARKTPSKQIPGMCTFRSATFAGFVAPLAPAGDVLHRYTSERCGLRPGDRIGFGQLASSRPSSREVRIRVPDFFSAVYLSRRTLRQKKGKRALLGDLVLLR